MLRGFVQPVNTQYNSYKAVKICQHIVLKQLRHQQLTGINVISLLFFRWTSVNWFPLNSYSTCFWWQHSKISWPSSHSRQPKLNLWPWFPQNPLKLTTNENLGNVTLCLLSCCCSLLMNVMGEWENALHCVVLICK